MKDYIELEQVKKFRDEFKENAFGCFSLYLQEIFFSKHRKEVDYALFLVRKQIKENRIKVDEAFCVPINECQPPATEPQTMWCILRDDGYLYFSSDYPLVLLGLGYRTKNGKVEECL